MNFRLLGLLSTCIMNIQIYAVKNPLIEAYKNDLKAQSAIVYDTNRSIDERLIAIRQTKNLFSLLRNIVGPRFNCIAFDDIQWGSINLNGTLPQILSKFTQIDEALTTQEQELERKRRHEEEVVREELSEIISTIDKEHQILARTLNKYLQRK